MKRLHSKTGPGNDVIWAWPCRQPGHHFSRLGQNSNTMSFFNEKSLLNEILLCAIYTLETIRPIPKKTISCETPEPQLSGHDGGAGICPLTRARLLLPLIQCNLTGAFNISVMSSS